ncbi:hypothetical protein PIB30_036704 [Stylosanthes scabra]|uniref:Uncharacterized protein n=1 Tax=Stylosanthes scabra TaxID=79078 RepID=A0ABU6ZAJ0_9FABA|nr:hypothetical protein [Stylosanthes scabra]
MGSEIADPIPEYIYRCKKASLLNSLKDELHNTPLIHEHILHKLEFLEELDYRIGSPVSPSFSAAYCAVAVECTLMHLSAHSSDDVISTDSAYVKAINRIWRDHISYMESSSSSGVGCQLYNAELKRWGNEIEASLSDPCVLKRLESYNSREDAISKLKAYLVEASQDLAAYFLAIAFFTASHADTCPASVESVRHKQEASKLASRAVRLHLALQRDLPFDTDLRDQYVFAAASAEECNESERVLHEGASDHATKIQLPSPKGWKISPLRKYEERNIIMRRKKKRWSELEVETLRSAVNQHGEGNWKVILSAHMDVFEERTDVDLKDKWRNIKRHRAN